MKLVAHKVESMITDQSQADLTNFISEYNKYIDLHLKKILELDAWYEMTTNKEFPREWYSAVRGSKG
jgi:hypothetical protein